MVTTVRGAESRRSAMPQSTVTGAACRWDLLAYQRTPCHRLSLARSPTTEGRHLLNRFLARVWLSTQATIQPVRRQTNGDRDSRAVTGIVISAPSKLSRPPQIGRA